jgi:glycine cleavage system P protein (glycine dehydrogenase) subunit 1
MRYLPLNDDDRSAMLAKAGVGSVEDLFRDVPAEARNPSFDLPPHAGEIEVERALVGLARRNIAAGSLPFFCGVGAYRHHVPATVDHLIQRSEFLTSYTPYQPEIAQGTLQALFEYQTQVAMLTAMEVANASLYDGSTASAEAVLMAHRITGRARAVLSGNLHPHYVQTMRTITGVAGKFAVAPAAPGGAENLIALVDGETSCVVVQNPDVFGNLRDLGPIAQAAHAKGALLIAVVTEAISFGLVEPPGAMGADIVAGEGQSLGNGLAFGGPYLGLFASREKFVRQLPGRLSGETVDTEGRRGYVLTLSAREQHIRREKATSNICTNSGLCALAFSIHLTLLGEAGFVKLAKLNHAHANELVDRLTRVKGVELVTTVFFNEFTLKLPRSAADVVDRLADRGIIAGVPASRLYPHERRLDDCLIVAATELTTEANIDAYGAALDEVLA